MIFTSENRREAAKGFILNNSNLKASDRPYTSRGSITTADISAIASRIRTYSNEIDHILITQRLHAEEIQRNRQSKFTTYIIKLVANAKIDPQTMMMYLESWNELKTVVGDGLPVPDACATEEGGLLFTLDNGPHHLELEIASSGVVEVFYRNAENQQIWSDEYKQGSLLSNADRLAALVEKIKPFISF